MKNGFLFQSILRGKCVRREGAGGNRGHEMLKGLTSRGRNVDMKAVIIIRNTLLKLNSGQETKAQK